MFFQSASSRARAQQRHRQPNHSRLNFERLEDRRVLSTVTTQAGLIAAINAANVAGGNNTITLGKNITLFNVDNITDGPNGLPAITAGDNLTILGNGHNISRSTASGTPAFRFFDVQSALTLKNLTLQGGLVSGTTSGLYQGGAIFVASGRQLTINKANLINNTVHFTGIGTDTIVEGGAIYNAGTTNINAVTVRDNSASITVTNSTNQGNGQGSDETTSTNGNDTGNGIVGNVIVRGGGIFNSGSLVVTSSSVLNNSATCTVINGSLNPAGGIGNGNSNGDDNSLGADSNGNVNGNGVNGAVIVEGGGICNINGGSAGLESDAFRGNRAACTIINGSDNGNDNSDNDNGDNNGDNNGNGVNGNVTVAGGALYSNFTFETVDATYISNSVSSTITNGNNNGNNNGDTTENVDGNENGNGVDGNLNLFGGAIANDSNGSETLIHCTLIANSITSTITNGNNSGNGNGQDNAGLGNTEGKNNGNGVAGYVHISGGAIDNEAGNGSSITNCIVDSNSLHSTITNGNNTGNFDGNNDGDGDALASTDNSVDVLVLHGAGIRNDGNLRINSTTIAGNVITSTIRNGNNDGDNIGNNNQENSDGRSNGNCVSGDVLIAGGGIANSGPLIVNKCTLVGNVLTSTIANGNNDGDNDGQGDGAFDNCGNDSGNAVGGDVKLDGGGLGNSGTATVTSSKILANVITSLVTNGKNDGQHDGGGFPASTGADGQGDGNGVHGELSVVGGGTANSTGASLTLTSTTVSGNVIHSTPSTGAGDDTLDGRVVTGTVTVSGANNF